MTPGAHLPTIQSPGWNEFRTSFIEALFQVKADLYARGQGLDAEGLAYEVAERLGYSIETPEDFAPVHKLVLGVHHVAKERLRRVLHDQNGQHRLPF